MKDAEKLSFWQFAFNYASYKRGLNFRQRVKLLKKNMLNFILFAVITSFVSMMAVFEVIVKIRVLYNVGNISLENKLLWLVGIPLIASCTYYIVNIFRYSNRRI